MSGEPVEENEFELEPGMMAEVMTPENRLIYVGKVEKIQSGGVYIREANEDTLPMVLVNKPVKVRFYQESTFTQEQRAYFRQSISVNIEARCGKRAGRGARPGVLSPCQVLDISAGGMLINCAEIFFEGESIQVTNVSLVAGTPDFSFNCQVRRAGEWKKGVNRYGCQFEALSPRDQDRLLQAIFTIQREEIKKRKAR